MAAATVTPKANEILLKTESYCRQKEQWPPKGKHILAQYDDDTIIVYQAFKPSIAEYAVQHQRFGGEDYSFQRMSWIKTNFLWMMYRCGWATKSDQQRVLAIYLSRKGFDTILANAYTAQYQKEQGVSTNNISVRLQWDPDHHPSYTKLERKAIQLGLKGKILEQFSNDWITRIEDISDFVKIQHGIFKEEGADSPNFLTASEKVYPVTNSETAKRIGVDDT